MLNVITQGSGALKNTFLSEFLKAREHPFLILVWEKEKPEREQGFCC